MDAQELGLHLRKATRSLFRLEMEPVYEVPTDGTDFQRYLADEPGPDMDRKGRWLAFLREQRDKGIYRHRVRVLTTPLSDYDRYACEWGYAYNVPAGDDTRILDVTTLLKLPETFWQWHDFWLVDDECAICMEYNRRGNFMGAYLVDPDAVDQYRRIRDTAWPLAAPFVDWWAQHPEFHRTSQKAS